MTPSPSPSLSREASLVDPAQKATPSPQQVDLEKAATATETKVPPRPIFPVSDIDQGIIGWEGQDDPNNPQNFAPSRKWTLLVLISLVSLISPLGSTVFSPALTDLAEDFGETDRTLLSFTVSIYLIGYVLGPLVFAPLSEIYGRRIVMSGANWFFVVWQIGCALAPNIASLTVMRFLAGCGGSACLTIGAGVIADLFPVHQRGVATSLWSLGPLLGPNIGPIAGGFIGQNLGWRWVFWILLIIGGALCLGMECFNRETYAAVLIRWKTEKMKKELGRTDLRSAYDLQGNGVSALRVLKLGMKRPLILLFKSPIIPFLTTYVALIYGLLYLFFTTIPMVFEGQYDFSPGIAGLAYLGIGIGFLLGLYISAVTSDRILLKLAARNGGKHEPEMRLTQLLFWACILPVSFFWYGWSVEKRTHWIVPIIGMAPFGIGCIGVWMPIQIYAIDCYPAYAASANAAMTAARSLVGALLPLAGPQMFETLGYGWGNSLLGFLALAFVPFAFLLQHFGKRLRERFKVDLEN
ncbi:MFS transporter [Aspergillus stella-maris]|uniref:MFS transporter n=1 Tax=Aspergillus stella-maris TaxID=1810926 RepID=UPI003CCD96D9